MKNILIPTDFSDNAWNAIKYAIHLYEQETCVVHLLHTYTPTAYAYDLNTRAGYIGLESLKTEQGIRYQASKDGLRETLERINDHYPNNNHSYNVISANNILSDEINKLIEKRQIDIIIMGAKGANGAKEVLFGSNTIYAMKKAKCPVLAIPDTFHFRYIDDILFPSDYKHSYTKKDVSQVIEVAGLNEATVHAFHISNELELSQEQQKNRDAIDSYFKKIKHDFKEVPDANVPNAIARYIDTHYIGMLAMTRRKHSFLERLLFKQKISVIGMLLKIPILVLPVK